MPAPSGQEEGSGLHVGHEHGRADHEHEDEDTDEDAENRTPAGVIPERRPAWTRLETVQGREQQTQQDGPADGREDQGPAPFAAGEGGQPGPREPDRGGREGGENRPYPAEQPAQLDDVKHRQPGAQHDEQDQPRAEMDRPAAARVEPVPEFFVAEPGRLGRGEGLADVSRGATRQRLAVAGLCLQARCLRMAGQQLADDL